MDCKTCKQIKNADVPYIVHEAAQARQERTIKRLWVLIILVITLLVATNGLWIWYESQFEDVVTTIDAQQETTRGNNYAIGGDLINGEADG